MYSEYTTAVSLNGRFHGLLDCPHGHIQDSHSEPTHTQSTHPSVTMSDTDVIDTAAAVSDAVRATAAALEKWDTDSDSDASDDEDLKM